MRANLEQFIELLNKKKFNEKKGIEVDYYSFDQIVELIYNRYHIVFTKPKWRSLKIEQGDSNVEELVNYLKFDDKIKSRRVLCSYREDICRYLEKLYIYITTQPQND